MHASQLSHLILALAAKAVTLERVRGLPRLTGMQRVAAGFSLAALLTLLLWVAGVIHDAATGTAYATMVLAIGTAGLAIGAIGTYVEQRKTNEGQAAELARQERRLELAEKNDIALVEIERTSAPGEFLRVVVTNNSSRVINYVYVYAAGHAIEDTFQTVVRAEDPQASATSVSRRMLDMRREISDGVVLESCYRAIAPKRAITFDQSRQTNPEEILNWPDEWIRTYAVFRDSEGIWWRCGEDGAIKKLDEAPPLVPQKGQLTSGMWKLPPKEIPPTDQGSA